MTGDSLKFVAEHIKSCQKSRGWFNNAKRKLVLRGDEWPNTYAIGRYVKDVFDGIMLHNYEQDNVVEVEFAYVWQRDFAVDQITKEVAAYRTAHPEMHVLEEPETTSDTTDSKAKDWVTNIIIGVAVAVIIALLIPWKKSKK